MLAVAHFEFPISNYFEFLIINVQLFESYGPSAEIRDTRAAGLECNFTLVVVLQLALHSINKLKSA
jgi:hypothetical protein